VLASIHTVVLWVKNVAAGSCNQCNIYTAANFQHLGMGVENFNFVP